MEVAIAARNTDKLSALCEETGAQAYACDAVDSAEVDQLFASVTADIGKPDVVVYNASNRARGPIKIWIRRLFALRFKSAASAGSLLPKQQQNK